MKTSSWTMLAKQRRLVSSDLNLSLFSPLPMKVFTVGSLLVGRYAFQCQRRILPALLVDSHPLSLSNRAPHSAEALEGALRLASPFSYGNEASHVLFNCPFLRLPDLSTLRPGPRIESYETPTPPEAAVIDWLNNRAPRLIPSRHRAYIPVPFGLVDYFNSHIHLPQVAMLIASHQCHNEAATAEARKHKRNYSPTDFLRVIPADTVMSGSLLPHPSPSPTPENLPRTALAPSQPNLHPRPSQASTIAQPAPSSHLAPTRPQHLPPTGPCSDPKRPRIPDSAPSTSHPGPMPSSLDSTRPVGSSAPSSHRSNRGPYTKGKDAATGMAYTFKGKGSDKGFTGKDTFASSWPPSTPGPPKGFAKNSPWGSPKGAAKGSEKGKFQGKGFAPPTVFAPPANFSLLADHKFPQRPHSYLPNFNGQPGHIVRFASSKLPSSGFMLSSFIPNSAPISILLSRIFPLCTPPFISSFLYSSSHPTSLWPAWAYCPARRLIFQSPLPPSLLLYSAYSFLSPFPRPSPAPSFGPRVFSRCSPNVALPNEAAPVVDRARRCGLSPCRAINWCRLWCAAVHERCSYVPPMLPVRTMFIEAAEHQLHYSMCLGIISNTSYLSRSSHPRY